MHQKSHTGAGRKTTLCSEPKVSSNTLTCTGLFYSGYERVRGTPIQEYLAHKNFLDSPHRCLDHHHTLSMLVPAHALKNLVFFLCPFVNPTRLFMFLSRSLFSLSHFQNGQDTSPNLAANSSRRNSPIFFSKSSTMCWGQVESTTSAISLTASPCCWPAVELLSYGEGFNIEKQLWVAWKSGKMCKN